MAVTDLTGTTWTINSQPAIPDSTIWGYINYVSNNESYTAITLYDEMDAGGNIAYRGYEEFPNIVYNGSNWTFDTYRTISITGGTDTTNSALISWLEANAVQSAAVQSAVVISYDGDTIATMDVSGTKTLQTAGKYCDGNIEVEYTAPTPSLQNKTVSPTTSSQSVTADSGYDGLGTVTVNAISPTKSAQTYTPTTSNQTISSGRWLTGAQTILGDANLVAENIAEGVTIFGVTGTHSGGLPGLTGSFTTQSSTGVQTISIPYTGSGYPLSISIVIDGGAWGKSSFSVGEIQVYTSTKSQPLVVPSYRGSSGKDSALRAAVYAHDVYGSKSYISGENPSYSTSNPKTTDPLEISSKTSIKIYVSADSGTTGFLANQKYDYTILYSE